MATWSVIVPCIPVVVMALRALASDWEPIGDAAYFAVRSRDVLTDHHPLLGAWSSGSSTLESSVNNLGPLQLDLLAPFTRLGGPAGLAVGIGLLNIAAIVTVWATARQLLGPLGVLGIVATTVLLEWSMGSRTLIEGRQQWALVLPMWCLIVLVWAVACGRSSAIAPLVFTASLIAQTHLTFAVVAVPFVVIAVVGIVASRLLDRRRGAEAEPLRRPLFVAAVVALVCWAQPLWEQLFDSGNFGRVLSNDSAAIGAAPGVRLVADVVATPPFWLADSITQFGQMQGLGSVSASAWRFGILVALTAALAAAVCMLQAGPLPVRVASILAPVMLLVSWWAASRIPSTSFGIAPQNYRWLWPLAAFVTFAVAGAAVALVRARLPATRNVLAAATAACIVGAAVPNLATVYRDRELRDEDRVTGVAGALRTEVDESLDGLEIDEPVVFDRSFESAFSPFGYSIMMGLQSAGVDFVFDAEIDAERFDDRRADDDEARSHPRLFIVTGSNIEHVGTSVLANEDVELMAQASGVTPAQDERRRHLDRTLTAALRDGTVEVDVSRGRFYFGSRMDPLVRLIDGEDPGSLWDAVRMSEGLVNYGLLSGDAELIEEVREWARLHRSHELEQVAVYLERT